MSFGALIITLVMACIVSPAMAEDTFAVAVELSRETLSLSDLPLFKHGGRSGYYFTIKVAVTNRASNKRTFMVDDDCTHPSWKLTGGPLGILVESCRQNVFSNISLNPGEAYSTTVKLWFPESYSEDKLNFKIGFVEIVDYKKVSGPYWSDFITANIRK